MSAPESKKLIVGQHEFRFFPPHRITVVMHGVFDEEHAHAYTRFIAEAVSHSGEKLEALFDLSELKSISAGARTRIAKRDRELPFRSVAIVGARFSIRTVSTMMMRAGKLIAPHKFAFDTKFFDSIDEANHWLDKLRKDKPKA